MPTFMVGLKWILGLNGFWAWNGFGFGMGFRLEWVLGLNSWFPKTFSGSLAFRDHLLSHHWAFVAGLRPRVSTDAPLIFRKTANMHSNFSKNQLATRHTPATTHTHTDAHTWFLPSTGDVCSSTGLRWGITLDNCSTGEIFGNSTKPDTSHDNHWL